MKKILLYLLVGFAILVMGMLVVYVFKDSNLFAVNDSIFVGVFDNSLNKGDSYVFTNYDDYVNTLSTASLTEESFINNNYVLVEVPYDSCSQRDVKLSNYIIEGNNIDVNITYKEVCKGCAPLYNYYLIKVDKTMTNVKVNVKYNSSNKKEC